MATTGDGDGEDLVRDVGRRIAEVRTAKGVTQEKFAEMLGIELRNAQRLEGGRANITLATLGRVARALGVRPADLLEPPLSRVTLRGRPRRSKGADVTRSTRGSVPSKETNQTPRAAVPWDPAPAGSGALDRAANPNSGPDEPEERELVGTTPRSR